ncbi:MAG: penicillin-binding protein 1C [Spirochaetes bacterium]|nr:penicillin-binding protein 1C [Spirochaetota bacterium]
MRLPEHYRDIIRSSPAHLRRFAVRFSTELVSVSAFVVLAIACLTLVPLPLERIENDFSTVYTDRSGALMRIALSPSGKYRIRIADKDISPFLRNGIVAYEDRWFYLHPGVNPVSIARAVVLNVSARRVISGGSTITMQLARMLERRPRTFGAKVIEAFRALQLELRYSKRELLSMYLNSIPMGGNIEGAGAAAYFYFGKNAGELSARESALLIGIPNSPNRNKPDSDDDTARVAQKVVSRIPAALGITGTNMQTAVSAGMHANVFHAPYLIESGRLSGVSLLARTTIDLPLQGHCEETLRRHAAANERDGIHNGAIIVCENRTGNVLAYAGNVDYNDSEHSGKINAAALPRSPGSVLKPFIYVKAVSGSLITPKSMLMDIPRSFDEYFPRNYDKGSRGLVSAEFALINSLNIPAVRLEQELNGAGLLAVLRDGCPSAVDAAERAGLTRALGGFGISLEDAVALYAALARGGRFAPLRYVDGGRLDGKQIMDEASCYIVSEMLSEYQRTDLPHAWEFSPHLAKAAFKTGTSFGLRDAWCIGYNPDYTVGVWLGNVNSRDAQRLIGGTKAAPLFFDIFNYITRDSDAWYKRPPSVAERKVCAVSGMKPGRQCRTMTDDLYIPGISPESECDVHRVIRVRKSDGREVCAYCMTRDAAAYEDRTVLWYRPEVATYMRSRGLSIAQAPEHNDACEHYFVRGRPAITEPSAGAVYAIRETLPLAVQKIPLKANVGGDAGTVYWFIGSLLVAAGRPDERFFLTPKRGSWKISVVDAKGRSDSVTIKIY